MVVRTVVSLVPLRFMRRMISRNMYLCLLRAAATLAARRWTLLARTATVGRLRPLVLPTHTTWPSAAPLPTRTATIAATASRCAVSQINSELSRAYSIDLIYLAGGFAARFFNGYKTRKYGFSKKYCFVRIAKYR